MKKPATRKPARTTRPTTAPPAGLVAAFMLIQMDGFAAGAARSNAEDSFPHATNIIGHLNGYNEAEAYNDLLIQNELNAAVRTMYSPAKEDPAESPQLMSFAGFHVGFAVCWLLMTAINGNGAR
jgi:hypothetical protein